MRIQRTLWTLAACLSLAQATSWHCQFIKGGCHPIAEQQQQQIDAASHLRATALNQGALSNISTASTNLTSDLFRGVPIAPLTAPSSNVTHDWATAHSSVLGFTAASADWTYEIAGVSTWADVERLALFQSNVAPYVPDGHTSSTPSQTANGKWVITYALGTTYTASSPFAFPVDNKVTEPAMESTNRSIGETFLRQEGIPWAVSGGFWIMGVQRLSSGGWVGFAHTETWWTQTGAPAWWTVRIAYSQDEGLNWDIGDTILSTEPFPATNPQWGGDGNMGVVWDPVNQRYICILGYFGMAASSDPLARPGSWLKWNGTDFSLPGINSTSAPIANLSLVQGSNPSIHFNTHLQRWIITYQSAEKDLYISSSLDLVSWEYPRLMINHTVFDANNDIILSYPTITASLGDTVAGQFALLTFGAINQTTGLRTCVQAGMIFSRID